MDAADDREAGFFLHLALKAPATLFHVATRVRSRLYDSGRLEIVDTGTPLISIGNLTVGGTGKTPITSFLATDLRARGFSCAIVTRGYGAEEKGPAIVDSRDAKKFGDEPTWLAAQHPDVAVVIGGRRPESVAFLKSKRQSGEKSPEAANERFLILADDGFQHRRLKRDLDIVILDATEPRWHYDPLPLGRMREGFEALTRASFIFLSKTNLAESAQLAWLKDQIAVHKKPIVEFGVTLKGYVPLVNDQPTAVMQRLSLQRAVLVSGIARPQTFEQLVSESVPGLKILKHFIFQDHAAFSASDLDGIETRAHELGAEAIIVTEKDATKLRSWKPKLPCYVSRLVAKPLSDLGEFHEAVDRLV